MIHAKLFQDPASRTAEKKKTAQGGAVLGLGPRNNGYARAHTHTHTQAYLIQMTLDRNFIS